MNALTRRRRGTAIASLVAASLLPVTPAFAETAAGSLTWGIRSSFNSYTGGPFAVQDGAKKNANNPYIFDFTLTDVTFDPETKRTEAQFDGTIIYRNYCGKLEKTPENCALDFNLEDPKVVISPEDSYLEATVDSKQYPDGGRFKPGKPVQIAKLHTDSATFSEQDGWVHWSDISTTLTEDGNGLFSRFYNVGEGLDPVSFSYQGKGAKVSESKVKLAPATWQSPAAFDSGVHQLFEAGRNVLVAAPGKGLALLNSDLEQLAFTEAPLSARGITAFDAQAGVFYFADGKQIKSIAVSGDTLGAPQDVHTAPHEVRALGLNPATKVLAAVSTDDFKAAQLSSGAGGKLADAPLPTAEQLFDDANLEYSAPWDNYNFGDTSELLPMPDGTFVYFGNPDVYFGDSNSSAKGLLYSIDPAAEVAQQRAVYMPGSAYEDNSVYLNSLVAHGTDLYRFNKNTLGGGRVQKLTYADRSVTPASEPVAIPKDQEGWAAMAFDAEGTPIVQNGATGELLWLNAQTLATEATFNLPNGRETANALNNYFLARPDGAIFVPTLDESRGDYTEYYVLRRLDTPTRFAEEAPGGEEGLENLAEAARKKATEAERAALEAADAALAAATESAKPRAQAERAVAAARLAEAEARFDAQFAAERAEKNPQDADLQAKASEAAEALKAATARTAEAEAALAALNPNTGKPGKPQPGKPQEKGSSTGAGIAGVALAAGILGVLAFLAQLPGLAQARQFIEAALRSLR